MKNDCYNSEKLSVVVGAAGLFLAKPDAAEESKVSFAQAAGATPAIASSIKTF